MDKELHHSHPVIRRIYLYIFIVTFLLFFVIFVLYLSQVQPFSQSEEPTTSEQITSTKPILRTEEKGSLTLSIQNNELNQVQVGQTFNISVDASSEDSDIVGFDVLLSYDQDAFTVGKASTPLQSFQLFSSQSDDHQSFTGALSTNGEATVLTDTQILTVPFTPTQKGKYTFTVLPRSGQEITKLVESETTKLFAPQVDSLQVVVN